MNEINTTELGFLFIDWIQEIVKKGHIKSRIPKQSVSDRCFEIECVTPYDYETK